MWITSESQHSFLTFTLERKKEKGEKEIDEENKRKYVWKINKMVGVRMIKITIKKRARINQIDKRMNKKEDKEATE